MDTNLLIATNNKGKVLEIRELLTGIGLTLLTPTDIGLDLEVEEDGATYAENASKKALAFASSSGLVSLADDSGLEVDALNGQPGLHSARFSPLPGASDSDRRKYLLGKLSGKPHPWAAHFHATVAVAVPGKPVKLVTGQCKGMIIPEERGTGGFGYDPIFLLPELDLTMAELPIDAKNRLSHRARAIQSAIPILKEVFGL